MRKQLRKLAGLGISIFLVGICLAGNSWAETYNLRAAQGTMTMPDGQVVTFWGYENCGTSLSNCSSDPLLYNPTLPGPVVEVPTGDTSLTINLKNDLGVNTSLIIPGQAMPTPLPAVSGSPDNTAKPSVTSTQVAAGGIGTFTFNGLRPGTFLYESGTDQAKQVQMGLYGALIVRDYPSLPSHQQEYVMVLSEIDPDWHATVAGGGIYNAVYFNPRYWLINGKA
ncbi:MAG: multicopper oxidase domain-containing protein, partial [Nitrospirae bacterium]|nr:multicopper oxidase domain-containing protein [Nitrospirota bacterium]